MDERLYASKALDLIWLPASWNALALHRDANGSWAWFWRVDPVFAAWAKRTLTRARAAKASLPGDPEAALRVILAYVAEADPTAPPTVDTLASAFVELPGRDLIATAAELARFGDVPNCTE